VRPRKTNRNIIERISSYQPKLKDRTCLKKKKTRTPTNWNIIVVTTTCLKNFSPVNPNAVGYLIINNGTDNKRNDMATLKGNEGISLFF